MSKSKINLRSIVWLLPVFYIIHLIEETFGGLGLHVWISEIVNVHFTFNVFVLINAVGIITFTSFAFYYTFGKANHFVFVAMGVLFFLNEIVHTAASLLTASYSPG